ncbi:hypothetical protein GQ600_19210 [Phytophthora cactorum]|nr:hypothetical protein GQ600_19210 [Phytophthora cactorum]
MAVAKSNPGLVSAMWADNTIVYFLHIMKRKNSHFRFLVRLHKAFIEERETVSHKPEDGLDSMVKQSDPRLYTTTMR